MQLARMAAAVMAALVLFACGGGDGSDSPPVNNNPPPGNNNPPPSVTTPPTITQQPRSQSVDDGRSVSFSVSADGTAPLTYQWNRDGNAIPGAASDTYSLSAVSMADNGVELSVTVANSAGAVTSQSAVLTVRAVPPVIVTHPASQTVLAGSTATFSVAATGSPPLSYQWRKDGAEIPGASSSTYITPPNALSSSGARFDVSVSNAAGTVVSSSAMLTVNGAPAPAGFSLSPTAITFDAASPNAAVPEDQVVTATYNGNETGTLRIVALGDGISDTRAVDSMTLFRMNGRTGQATVRASGPDLLGPGTYTQTITIKACINGDSICSTNELPGSPKTLTVTYVIGPPPAPPDAVMPRIAIAGASARVIVRGTALSGVTSVHFGSHAATNVSVVSDTEVHATYPALSQGTYAVVLNSGAIPFAGSIVAVPPTDYSARLLDLPEDPAHLSFLRYDAERSALLAGGFYFRPAGVTNKLWRFNYDGLDWSSPQTLALAGLNNAALSGDGSRIFALADEGLIELDADDLSVLHTTPHPNPSVGLGRELLNSIGIANNGIALISAGTEGISGPNPLYYFSTVDRTFRPVRPGLFNSGYGYGLLGSQDGSRILGSVRGISPAQRLLNYNASTTLRTHILGSDQRFPTLDTRHGQTIVVDPRDGFPLHFDVYSSQSEVLLGVLPGPTSFDDPTSRIRLVELNPQGTRAYVLREDDMLHTYALDQPTVAGAFVEVGSPITVDPPTEAALELITTMTPDGRTLFIGGNRGVLVIPVQQP